MFNNKLNVSDYLFVVAVKSFEDIFPCIDGIGNMNGFHTIYIDQRDRKEISFHFQT